MEDFDQLEEEQQQQREEQTRASGTAAAEQTRPLDPLAGDGDGDGDDDDDGDGGPTQRKEAAAEEEEEELDKLPPELMEGLRKLAEELSSGNKEGADALGSEEMMKEALDQLENSPEFASMMEKMMGSILSKDVLYEPMKEMKDRVLPLADESADTARWPGIPKVRC